jgi:N6-adenosine-specific RNA methylase IME4
MRATSAAGLPENQEPITIGPFAGLTAHAYRVISADPGWDWRARSSKGTGRSAISHFDTTPLGQLMALPVAELAAPDCALFMWAIDSMHTEAHALIAAWGFTLKTVGFYWVKTGKDKRRDHSEPRLLDPLRDFPMGCGYSTRANPETCFLATRGRPKRLHCGIRRLIVSSRLQYGRKPPEALERIGLLYPGPYLELFSRESRPGWDSWGWQAGLFDSGPLETRRQPSHLVSQEPRP